MKLKHVNKVRKEKEITQIFKDEHSVDVLLREFSFLGRALTDITMQHSIKYEDDRIKREERSA